MIATYESSSPEVQAYLRVVMLVAETCRRASEESGVPADEIIQAFCGDVSRLLSLLTMDTGAGLPN